MHSKEIEPIINFMDDNANSQWREDAKGRSNNYKNPNKNMCVLAVAEALHCADKVKYLHCHSDLVVALNQTRYTVSITTKETSYNILKDQLREYGEHYNSKRHETMGGGDNTIGFLISTIDENNENGHIMFLHLRGDSGNTDTSPKMTEMNNVYKITMVCNTSLTNLDSFMYKKTDEYKELMADAKMRAEEMGEEARKKVA